MDEVIIKNYIDHDDLEGVRKIFYDINNNSYRCSVSINLLVINSYSSELMIHSVYVTTHISSQLNERKHLISVPLRVTTYNTKIDIKYYRIKTFQARFKYEK